MQEKIILPDKVKLILDALMAEGYEAFAVGGCIRDSLLSRVPNDWDITTSAKPEQVKAIFRRSVDTGIKHGTVTVMLGKEGFEVTTYRIDGEYIDGRHPKQVIFTNALEEDLKRRDFTINAMAYNDRDGLVDLFGGQKDLENGLIRAVGDPKERFSEDALRILRAVRFAAQLGYKIDQSTKDAASKLADNLKKISAERIRVELVKLMTSSHPDYLKTAYEMGITSIVFPEFDVMMKTSQNHPHHNCSVGEHTIKAYSYIKEDKYDDRTLLFLRLGLLFHDIGKPECHTIDEKGIDHFRNHALVGEKIATDILRRLKFDNKTINCIRKIVLYHDLRPRLTYPKVRESISVVGIEVYSLLFDVMEADVMAQSDFQKDDKLEAINKLKTMFCEIIERKDPLFLGDLAINGNTLIEKGIASGADIGIVLKYLLKMVINNPEKNTEEKLLKMAEDYRSLSEQSNE